MCTAAGATLVGVGERPEHCRFVLDAYGDSHRRAAREREQGDDRLVADAISRLGSFAVGSRAVALATCISASFQAAGLPRNTRMEIATAQIHSGTPIAARIAQITPAAASRSSASDLRSVRRADQLHSVPAVLRHVDEAPEQRRRHQVGDRGPATTSTRRPDTALTPRRTRKSTPSSPGRLR